MADHKTISLDNKTIARLAIAFAKANDFVEVGDEMVRKVLEALDQMEQMEHFRNYHPKA